MEIISVVFGLILSLIVDVLYEISVVNNLFSFDLKDKNILIKNNRDNFENIIFTNKKVNNKYKELKEIFTSVKTNNIINNSFNIKPTDNRSDNLCLIINGKNNNINNNEDIYSKTSSNKVKSDLINIKRNDINHKKEIRGNMIYKIELNHFLIHLCFCCVKKKVNINNILLNEGMNIVSEKLDIFNIFKIINRNEKTLKNLKNYEKIDMSVECIKNLNKIK